MPKRRSFVTLDGLRGVAALAVVTQHASAFFGSRGGPDPSNTLFSESYLAVDFFFALSGFVLAHAYGQRLRGGMSPSHFMAIRLIRLYPLYFLALILSLVVAQRQLTHGETSAAILMPHVLAALMFLPSPASAWALFPLNYPAWSLFFEMAANSAFGLMGRRVSDFLLIIIVAAAALVLAGATIFGWLGFGHEGLRAMDAGSRWDGLGAGVLRVAFSFFAGVLVYRAWQTWPVRFNIPPALVAMALAAVLAAHPSQNYQVAFDLAATLLVFPTLIWLGAWSVPTAALARLFSAIGAASYGIYVLQVPLYEIAHRMMLSLTGGRLLELPWIMSGVAFEALVLGVAIIADKYFDRPVREALSARLLAPAHTTVTARSAPP